MLQIWRLSSCLPRRWLKVSANQCGSYLTYSNLWRSNLLVEICVVFELWLVLSAQNVLNPISSLCLKWGHPWLNGSALDYWPTGRGIDPAPGTCFITNFISIALVLSGPVKPYSAESWPKTRIISVLIYSYFSLYVHITHF